LNVFPVQVPALRERPEDIPPLVAHFAEKYGARFGRKISGIDRQTLDLLQSHSWPGNVRELENVVERAVILSRGGALHLDKAMLTAAKGNSTEQVGSEERQAIETALTASRGKVAGESGAAKKLGVPASTLEFRIKRLGIDKFRYRKR
jgi:formate hydrogenlyase transcriptional activator